MDNFSLDAVGRGREGLAAAVLLAFLGRREGVRAVAYAVYPDHGLVLYDSVDPLAAGPVPFLNPLDAEEAATMAWVWLGGLTALEFRSVAGPWPDFDGSAERGWRVRVGPWGQVGSEPRAFLSVKPAWALLHK
jgi:hypothetical protein